MARDLNAMLQESSMAGSEKSYHEIPHGTSFWRFVAPETWSTPYMTQQLHRYGSNPNSQGRPYVFSCPASLGSAACPLDAMGAQYREQGNAEAASYFDTEPEAICWAAKMAQQAAPDGSVVYVPISKALRISLKKDMRQAIDEAFQVHRLDICHPTQGVVVQVTKTGSGLRTDYKVSVLQGYPGGVAPLPERLWADLATVPDIRSSGIVEAPKHEDLLYLIQNGTFPKRDREEQGALPGGAAPRLTSAPPPTGPPPGWVQQPVAQQPVAQQPVAQQPVAQQPVAQQPAAAPPWMTQPVAQQPVAQQPVAQQPVAQQPVAQPVAGPPPGAAVVTQQPVVAPPGEQPAEQPSPLPPAPTGDTTAESQAALAALDAIGDLPAGGQ